MSGSYVRTMMMNNTYVRSVIRFWPIVLIGAVLAVFAAIEMVASVQPAFPPKVKVRTLARYSATELLLVNSPQNPLVRTAITNVVPKPAKTAVIRSGGRSSGSSSLTQVPQAPSISIHSPNVAILVRAANLYPRLIESDPVTAVRNRMFGPLHGSVVAAALNSFQTPTKYRASQFPVIALTATARHPKAAIALALDTAAAFQAWLKQTQAASGVPQAERILVDDLSRPTTTVSTGGPKLGLPLFVGIAVFAAFLGLVIVLDRLRLAAAAAAAEMAGRRADEIDDVETALVGGVAERRSSLEHPEAAPGAQPAGR